MAKIREVILLPTFRFFTLLFLIILLAACSTSDRQATSSSSANHNFTHDLHPPFISSNTKNPNNNIDFSSSKLEEIYFAGGCFWGVEAYFQRIYGVFDTASGYANGSGSNPTYKIVSSEKEGFAETVEVIYDPERVTLEDLLAYFFLVIDPTILNQQGNDIGIQYRTGIYYSNDEHKKIIDHAVQVEQNNYDKQIVTEVVPLDNFYLAEEYHQDYLAKNPNGYCHIDLSILDSVSIDPIKYKKPNKKEIKEKLTEEQYTITMENGTENAYENDYWDTYEPGIYVDIVTGEPLFSSSTKYNAECGWPSFTKPIDPNVITYHEDTSENMTRTEIRSRVGDIHLGHVFEDGPESEGGKRYCINSAALTFIHVDEMKEKGYGHLVNLVE